MVRFVNVITASLIGLLLCGPVSLRAQAPEQTIRSQLTPRHYALISSETSGRIDRLPLREGAAFKQGDVLIAFDDVLQQAQVTRARAMLTVAERTMAANKRLLELNSIGELEFEVSKAEAVKAAAELTYSEAMLAKCRILAPFSGRIAELKVRENEFVQTGQALFEIIDAEVPELEFIAPSKWLAWLAVGQSLTVRIDETNREYAAVIERIGAKVDPVSRTVKIVATITGDHPELAAGMSGTIQLKEPTSVQAE